MYKEENQGATKGLLILILIAISITAGFIFGIKYQKQEYEKNKQECPICPEEKVEQEEELLPISSYNLVDINYEIIESTLKDINYESKTCTGINDNTQCYIINIINNNNLLSNESFKFAFTFRFGYITYNNLYTLNENNKIEIKEKDFEKIYNNLYNEKYEFSKINEINYDYENEYIIAEKYENLETKYQLSNNIYEDNTFTTIINSLNIETNTYTNVSPYNLIVKCKSNNNQIYLESLKIESNNQIGE